MTDIAPLDKIYYSLFYLGPIKFCFDSCKGLVLSKVTTKSPHYELMQISGNAKSNLEYIESYP